MPSARSKRVAERRRHQNAPLRSAARTHVTKVRRLIETKDVSAAEQAIQEAIIILDKAAQKGAIHKKNAARRKSRLMAQLNAARNS